MESDLQNLKYDYELIKSEVDALYQEYDDLNITHRLADLQTEYNFIKYKYNILEHRQNEIEYQLKTIRTVNNYLLSLHESSELDMSSLSTLIKLQNSIIDNLLGI